MVVYDNGGNEIDRGGDQKLMIKKRVKTYILSVCIVISLFVLYIWSIITVSDKKTEIKIREAIYTEEFKAEEDSQQESVSIELHYPQISGMGDSAKEERINALIRQDIFEILEHEPLTWPDYCFSAGTICSEVKFLNGSIVSIFYTGYCGYISPGRGVGAPFGRAITIDIESERIMALDDVISDFDTLSTLLMDNKFENITEWEGQKGNYPFNRENVTRPNEWKMSSQCKSWYTDGKNLVIIETVLDTYNEYSKNIRSVYNIFKEDFIKKIK